MLLNSDLDILHVEKSSNSGISRAGSGLRCSVAYISSPPVSICVVEAIDADVCLRLLRMRFLLCSRSDRY